MKSLPTSTKVFLLLALGIIVIMTALFLFSLSNQKQDSSQTAIPQTQDTQLNPLTISDVENILVHLGLDIQCPDIAGVSQNGYVYTVSLSNNRGVIERNGCGEGEPSIFADAIAKDLTINQDFASLSAEDVLSKLTFKVYSPN